MSTLSKVTFAFHAGLGQYFLFTGSIDNPAEINNVTPSVQEGIIAAYLVKPGVLTAPDGSEFLLELSLLSAFREAKQRALDEAQAKITEANALVQPAPVEDIAWMADLTNADKEHLKRIVAARRNGQRVSYSYSVPFEFRVKLGPAPPKKKEPKLKLAEAVVERDDLKWNEDKTSVEFVPNPEGKSYMESVPRFSNDEVATQQQTSPPVERVPVVVLTVPESNSECFIVERKKFDEYALYGVDKSMSVRDNSWLEGALYHFCADNGLSRDDITAIDFEQTRTREELDNLPDFQF